MPRSRTNQAIGDDGVRDGSSASAPAPSSDALAPSPQLVHMPSTVGTEQDRTTAVNSPDLDVLLAAFREVLQIQHSEWLTLREAAAYIKVSADTMRRLVASGAVKSAPVV